MGHRVIGLYIALDHISSTWRKKKVSLPPARCKFAGRLKEHPERPRATACRRLDAVAFAHGAVGRAAAKRGTDWARDRCTVCLAHAWVEPASGEAHLGGAGCRAATTAREVGALPIAADDLRCEVAAEERASGVTPVRRRAAGLARGRGVPPAAPEGSRAIARAQLGLPAAAGCRAEARGARPDAGRRAGAAAGSAAGRAWGRRTKRRRRGAVGRARRRVRAGLQPGEHSLAHGK